MTPSSKSNSRNSQTTASTDAWLEDEPEPVRQMFNKALAESRKITQVLHQGFTGSFDEMISSNREDTRRLMDGLTNIITESFVKMRQLINQDVTESFKEMMQIMAEDNKQSAMRSVQSQEAILSSIRELVEKAAKSLESANNLGSSREPKNSDSSKQSNEKEIDSASAKARIMNQLPEKFFLKVDALDLCSLEKLLIAFKTVSEIGKSRIEVDPIKKNWDDSASNQITEASLEDFNYKINMCKKLSGYDRIDFEVDAPPDWSNPNAVRRFISRAYSYKWKFYVPDSQIWRGMQRVIQHSSVEKSALMARVFTSSSAYSYKSSRIDWPFLFSVASTLQPNPIRMMDKVMMDLHQYLFVDAKDCSVRQYAKQVHSEALVGFLTIQNSLKSGFNLINVKEMIQVYKREQPILCEFIAIETSIKAFGADSELSSDSSDHTDISWWKAKFNELIELFKQQPERFCFFFENRLEEIRKCVKDGSINQSMITYWNTRLVGTISDANPIVLDEYWKPHPTY